MKGQKCDRCGYILNKRDNEPMYAIKRIRWGERDIVLCRFCNNDLDDFLRGFPIWATSEFEEVAERYNGLDRKKESAKIIKLKQELRDEMEKIIKSEDEK